MLMNRAFHLSQSQKRSRQRKEKQRVEQQRLKQQAASRRRISGGGYRFPGIELMPGTVVNPGKQDHRFHFSGKPDGAFDFECIGSDKFEQLLTDYHLRLFKSEVNCRALPRAASPALLVAIRVLALLQVFSSFIVYLVFGIVELYNFGGKEEWPFTWRSKPFTYSDFPDKSLAGLRIAEFVVSLAMLVITGIGLITWTFSALTRYQLSRREYRNRYLVNICNKYAAVFSQASGLKTVISVDREEVGIYMKIEDRK